MKRSAELAIGLLTGLLGTSCGLVTGVDFGAVQPEGTGGAASTSAGTSTSAGG